MLGLGMKATIITIVSNNTQFIRINQRFFVETLAFLSLPAYDDQQYHTDNDDRRYHQASENTSDAIENWLDCPVFRSDVSSDIT